jgi:murein endopeptidase
VRRAALALTAALAGLATGCVQLGVVSDGTSVSWGPANQGMLLGAVPLPLTGDGFVVHATWAARDTQWGIDELIAVVAWTAREVARAHPGTELAIGDLSIAGGGRSAHHRSHQTGRDVDLVLFGIKAAARCRRPRCCRTATTATCSPTRPSSSTSPGSGPWSAAC